MIRRRLARFQDRKKPLEVPDTVLEGGVLVIHVNSGVSQIGLVVPGLGAITVAVPRSKRVEYRLPPHVRGGDGIAVTDLNFPNPAGTSVRVIAP